MLHPAAGMDTKLRSYALGQLESEGFETDLSSAVAKELEALAGSEATSAAALALSSGVIRDMRELAWSSIDNRETRDVDQIEYTEATAAGTRVYIGIADVDVLVPAGSAVDARARQNTVSVYGVGVLLPMLPEALSEGLTSLLPNADRAAIVAEFVVTPEGSITAPSVYRALVRNTVQLDYDTINDWLAAEGELPAVALALGEQLRLQHEAAVRLRGRREELGALEFERHETRPVVEDGVVTDIAVVRRGAARDLIEDFMIAANAVIAGFLEANDVAWIRRMVGPPERWSRIVTVLEGVGMSLPASPDRIALARALRRVREERAALHEDLSSQVLRLLGAGAYVVEHRAEELDAHFALAVDDYTHFTAPNRRYADLVTQRIVKAVLAGAACPYADAELESIAAQCTLMEDRARNVERRVARRAAAMLLEPRVGDVVDAIVTGQRDSGATVELLHPAVEGQLSDKVERKRGDRIRVRIEKVDVEKSAFDFVAT